MIGLYVKTSVIC